MRAVRRWILHPFLFSLFPILALLTHNLAQVKPVVGLRSMLISLLLTAVLLVGLRIILRDWYRAAIACSFLLLLFFSYGHLYDSLKTVQLGAFLLGRHRLLAPAWAAIFALGFVFIAWRIKDLVRWTEALNLIALVLLLFPLFQLVSYGFDTLRTGREAGVPPDELAPLAVDQTPPDIYYIILDAYSRQDVLQDVFSYDNTEFLTQLEGLGFYVASCSQSNYAHTELALASTLNLNYLEALGSNFVSSRNDRTDLRRLINKNAVRQELEALGYSTVAFETGYYWTQLEDATYYYAPSQSVISSLEIEGGINSFEAMLLDTTAGLLLTDAASVLPQRVAQAVDYPERRHYERVLFSLQSLEESARIVPGPKFVFAHILTPHAPYVFNAEGEYITVEKPIDQERFVAAYGDQITFINREILGVVRSILANSQNPSIIIIQGDHGAPRLTPGQRTAVLNAYYFPPGTDPVLYEGISPVNTFRLVFNQAFNAGLELLEDRSYYSTLEDLYGFEQVDDPAEWCAGE